MKIKKIIREILLFSIVIFILSNAISLYRSTDLSKNPLDLSNVTLIDNKKYIIDTTKPLMLHIWATWCPICKAEASNIQTISDNFQLISIATQSGDDESIKKYQKENSIDFMVINDKNGTFAKKYGINVFPTTIIYDANQKVIFSDVGYTSTWSLWLKMLWASL